MPSNERAKKKFGGGLEQLILSLYQINANLKESFFRLTGDATFANKETSRINAETNLKLKRAKMIDTSTRGMRNAEFVGMKDITNITSSNNKKGPFLSMMLQQGRRGKEVL
jgi:hypothetical protein